MSTAPLSIDVEVDKTFGNMNDLYLQSSVLAVMNSILTTDLEASRLMVGFRRNHVDNITAHGRVGH